MPSRLGFLTECHVAVKADFRRQWQCFRCKWSTTSESVEAVSIPAARAGSSLIGFASAVLPSRSLQLAVGGDRIVMLRYA
eukprot:SAG31_NODE_419_length_15872_cov_21.857985_3_plen_80_part_00